MRPILLRVVTYIGQPIDLYWSQHLPISPTLSRPIQKHFGPATYYALERYIYGGAEGYIGKVFIPRESDYISAVMAAARPKTIPGALAITIGQSRLGCWSRP